VLKQNGFRDLADLAVGEDAQLVIEQRLRDSDAVLFFDTALAHTSEWVARELRIALRGGIPIVWIKAGDHTVPNGFPQPARYPHLALRVPEVTQGDAERSVSLASDLVRESAVQVLDASARLRDLGGVEVEVKDPNRLVYTVRIRCGKAMPYPQECTKHLVQFFGIRPRDEDARVFLNLPGEYTARLLLVRGDDPPQFGALLRGGAHQGHGGVVLVEVALLEGRRHGIPGAEVDHVQCAQGDHLRHPLLPRGLEPGRTGGKHTAHQFIAPFGGGDIGDSGDEPVGDERLHGPPAAAGGMEHQAVEVAFEPVTAKHVALLHRTHPLVEGLATYVLNSALDPLLGGLARRAGVIRSKAVTTRTTLMLLRLRFHIVTTTREGERHLLAEDALLTAFTGDPAAPLWLPEADAVRVQEIAPQFQPRLLPVRLDLVVRFLLGQVLLYLLDIFVTVSRRRENTGDVEGAECRIGGGSLGLKLLKEPVVLDSPVYGGAG